MHLVQNDQICGQFFEPLYVLASVPSPAPSDRSSGALNPEHAAELRLNKVDYITLENVDPAAIKAKIHDLLLQAIQDAHSAGYYPLSPLYMPELTTPPLCKQTPSPIGKQISIYQMHSFISLLSNCWK